MKYCAKCGTQVNEEVANFCPSCGFQIQNTELNAKEPTNPQHPKFTKSKVTLISILVAVAIFVIGIISIIATPTSEPTLARCENLVGAPIEDILNSDDYNISKLLDIRMVTAKTDKVFGVNGEIQFVFTEDDECIDMVTWMSDDNVRLTESEIAAFVEGMMEVYGKPKESSDDLYIWNTKQRSISVFVDDDEIMVNFCNNT